MISIKWNKHKPEVQSTTKIWDIVYSMNGRYEWICWTDRNFNLVFIEWPLQPRTR